MKDESISSTQPAGWNAVAVWLLLAGAAVHGTMILQAEPLQSANDKSRWCTVWSLLNRGTYQIDEIRSVRGWDTIDLYRDGGHFYSTKPPILATWVSGVAWCVMRLTGRNLLRDTQNVTSWTLLIVNGLPMLFSWILWKRMLDETVSSAWGRGLLLAAAVFATLLTPFAVTLNNHTVAAAGAWLTIYSLWRILRDEHPHWAWFTACGFAAAWTCAHELPAALIGLITFGLCAWKSFGKATLAFLPAAAIPLAAFFVINWIATGELKPAYASFGTEKYNFVIDGVPSYWMEPKGIDRNLDRSAVYLMHCLVGHHGLFSLTPLWLLLFPAWTMLGQVATRPLKLLSAMSLGLTIIILAFYLSRTENYNYGGVSCGLRWALWLTPFWLVSLIPLANAWADVRWFRVAVVPLFLLSAFSAWSRVDNPWKQPWIFVWMESRGWIDYSEPRPALPRPMWSWIAALPDVSDEKPRWMEFRNASAIQGDCRMRIEVAPVENGDAAHVHLSVTRSCASASLGSTTEVELIRAAFESGGKPADFVRWPDAEVSPEQQQGDLAFIRGLPLLKEFRPGVFRYRKTLLRTDAFRCQHALALVEMDAPGENRRLQYRCDVWLCDELPFGIAEVEFLVSDATTGLLLHQERWQAAACEPPPLPRAQWSPTP